MEQDDGEPVMSNGRSANPPHLLLLSGAPRSELLGKPVMADEETGEFSLRSVPHSKLRNPSSL
ncbi:hypothetical protein MUK42_33057 [Musa troglodytarum]|nr:hypothetical protein MUK42_33057 [Musa troglodytarum]